MEKSTLVLLRDNIGYCFGGAWNLSMFCVVGINIEEEFVQITKKRPKLKRGAQRDMLKQYRDKKRSKLNDVRNNIPETMFA